MSIASIQNPFREIPVNGREIPGNSEELKWASCIPLVGLVVSLFQEGAIVAEIRSQRNPERLIELIEVKNQYKLGSVIRNVLLIAIVATSVALGALGITTGALCTALLAWTAKTHTGNIAYNNDVISDLRNNGFRDGILVK